MKIILVDDHRIVVDGLSQLLDSTHEIIGTFSYPFQALNFIQHHDADLLIADYEMPELNGIELYKRSTEIRPLLKGVLLSMHDEAAVIKRALHAGMQGYLLKSVSKLELSMALEKIRQGHTYISAELTSRLLEPDAPSPLLSARERDVLSLILKEFTNKQIADTLHLSERTVETYRKNLFKKANTTNIVGLIKFAYTHNLT